MAPRLVTNKNFRNALQVLSLAIICCTLIIYQVTYAKNELLAQQDSATMTVSNSPYDGSSNNSLVNSNDTSRVNRDNQPSSYNRYDRSVSNLGDDSNNIAEKSRINSHAVESYNQVSSHEANRVNDGVSAKEGLIVDNVFLSVKSTKRFHQTRLKPILKTWFSFAKDQTWIFTDGDDPELEHQTNGHIINTHCPATHYRQALCCKMSMEFDAFLRTTKSWFCHFDDDNYVNVPALLELLGKYNHWEDWYLGKPSLKGPIHIPDPNNRTNYKYVSGGRRADRKDRRLLSSSVCTQQNSLNRVFRLEIKQHYCIRIFKFLAFKYGYYALPIIFSWDAFPTYKCLYNGDDPPGPSLSRIVM
ncbi:unnamed protein product [Allacma fusca]|uniref:Fringe-like glycosyltransferase domain-containing protein n=1 Tax=Allacma fusca TaxID=39272 RepID=A0A8J2J2Z2_9HEXA|nr:unnamed protein product [Allacma fusca]